MNTQFRFKCTLTVDKNHILNSQVQTKQINKRNYLLIHTPKKMVIKKYIWTNKYKMSTVVLLWTQNTMYHDIKCSNKA